MNSPAKNHGHRRKDGQAQFVLSQEAKAVAAVDWPALDAWLSTALGLVPPWANVKADARIESVEVTNLAVRAYALSQALFKAMRIPIFEPVLILSVLRSEPSSDASFRIQALAPTLDHLPSNLPSFVHQFGLRLLTGVAQSMAQGVTPSIDDVRKQVQRDLLQRLQNGLPFGISTVPILTQAWKDKIPFRHLGAGVFLLGWGAQSRRIHRSSIDADSAMGSHVSTSKVSTLVLLRGAGLPCPEHQLVKNVAEAKAVAKRLGWPVVIKPADRERSEGVSVRMGSDEDVEEAYALAAKYSRHILVEQQIPGICYRMMVANGEFLYAVWRRPPAVVGDGVHSIAQLLALQAQVAQQQPPWQADKSIPLDALTEKVLASQGLSAQTVPAEGQRVAVRFLESTEWGEDRGDATGQAHPANIALAERAARALGLRNAGVDIISPDIAVPWYDNGAAVNEVNFAPHFGGTATARSHMPRFMAQLVQGQGRIPLEVFVGGAQALAAAQARQAQWCEAGVNAWLSSALETISPTGQVEAMALVGSFERTQALLADTRVQALAVVLQDDQWLRMGAPVNRIDAWHVCDALPGVQAPAAQALQRLLASLK